jgi:hypothetical protein
MMGPDEILYNTLRLDPRYFYQTVYGKGNRSRGMPLKRANNEKG